MKLLVDASAGYRLAVWLASVGHDAVFSPDLGPDPGDDELLRIAYRDGRVVITLDRNFGKSVYTAGVPSPGIVILPWVPHDARKRLVEAALAIHEVELRQGCWVVAELGRFRMHVPPGVGEGEQE